MFQPFVFMKVALSVVGCFSVQAVMTGNSLPNELDLISLAQTESNRIYVIVENGHGQQTGPPVLPTPPPTRRPSRPEMASVTFTSGRSYLRLPQWSPGRRGKVCLCYPVPSD